MIIDIIFVLILVLSIYKGFTKGFIIALCSLLAWVLGLAAALKLSSVSAAYFHNHYHINTRWLPVITFILLFIIVVIIVRLIAKLLEKVVQLALLGWLNRLLGICLYLLVFTFIFSIVLWLGNQLYFITPSEKVSSRVYNYIAPLGPAVINSIGHIIPAFQNIFHDLENFFGGISKKNGFGTIVIF